MTEITNGVGGSSSATIAESVDTCSTPLRLFNHLKEPQNLLNYMIFTAYMKYMEVFSWIPTITIG